MTANEEALMRRRPMDSTFGLIRVLFALGTLVFLVPRAPDVIGACWGVAWAVSFVRDLMFGLSPTQGPIGCLLDVTAWGLWVAVTAFAIF